MIAGCHLIGLLFELVKVRLGSWSYPEPALTKIAGVPLYGGFLYSAVGSYVCRSWRLLDLRLTGYRPRVMALLAVAVYLNFFTHHWLPDARWVLAALMLCATAGTWVHYSVGAGRYRMPLALAFVLIGFFLWIAENAATYAGAWSYPDQLAGWQPVTLAKAGAWALLISVTFVLATLSRKGVPEWAAVPAEAAARGGGGASRRGRSGRHRHAEQPHCGLGKVYGSALRRPDVIDIVGAGHRSHPEHASRRTSRSHAAPPSESAP